MRQGQGRPGLWSPNFMACLSLPYSSSPDETEGKPKVPQQEDGPKGRCQLGTSQGVGVHSEASPAHPCDLCPRCG